MEQDPPTADLHPETYEEATADVDQNAPKVKPTFVAAPIEPTAHESPVPDPTVAARTQNDIRTAKPRVEPTIDPPASPAAPPIQHEPAAPREISTGSLLNRRYLLGRTLGVGGASLVFQAEDRRRAGAEDFGNKIAIKVLRPEMRHNSHALTRLKREFRQMQRLSHRGIARVFELACDEDVWFLTMELIDGLTINQWLKTSTTRAAALQIIAGCCEALTHAHECGIVHGDLKPSNVLVLPDGKVKLVDFGSAAERDAATGEVDQERSFAATPPYASPQVLAGEIADPRDDVFSLACLAYAVLTHGEHPFDRKSSAEAQQLQMKPAYSRALLPRQFDVIVRALAWEREHRPATVREFWHALLASDLRREGVPAAPAISDVASRPMPSTPTRDAPTVAATKSEKTQEPARPATPAAEPVASNESRKREPTIKHEDILRLKAAIAAAEAHADEIEHPGDSATKHEHRSGEQDERAVDPLAHFRGYVAGPLAQRDDESSDVASLAQESREREAPKKSKRTWPWQRSAWIVAAVIAGTLVFTAFRMTSEPEHETPSLVRDVSDAKRTGQDPEKPSAQVAAAPASIAEPAQPVAEKKSPPVAVKPSIAPAVQGEVSFATRTLQVGVGQTMAAISVRRVNSTRGRARVAWTIEGGTAQPGVDYRVGDTQVIEFLEGQNVRSLFIPLVPDKDSSEARTSKTFTVRLQPTSGGPKLGEIKQVYVTIVGDVAVQRVAQRGAE